MLLFCICLSFLAVNGILGAYLIDFKNNPYRAKKWNSTNIGFRLSRSLYPNETTAIRDALKQFQDQTCLKFHENSTLEENGIVFFRTYKEKCRGTVGKQPMNVIYGYWRCFSKPGYILHEVMHNLGFRHEHQRADRDRYIKIVEKHIEDKMINFFKPLNPSYHNTYGTNYDPYSVMHYEPTLFAKYPDKLTMEPTGENIISEVIGQKRWLSKGDIDAINMIYCQSS